MSRTAEEKRVKAMQEATPGKSWKGGTGRVTILAVLAAVLLAALLLLLISCGQETIPQPGNMNPISGNNTSITPPGTKDLIISNILVYDVGVTSVSASWTTNLPATTELHASVAARGTTFSSFPDTNLRLAHAATIYALIPATEYKLTLVSADASGKKVEVPIEKLYATQAKRTRVGLSVGETCPDFSLKSITGKTVGSSDLAGKRTLLIIWAYRYNRDQMPYMDTFYKEAAGGSAAGGSIELVTICAGVEAAPVQKYMQGNKLDFPVLLDPNLQIENKFALANYPTSFLIDPGGKIVRIKEGTFRSADEISALAR